MGSAKTSGITLLKDALILVLIAAAAVAVGLQIRRYKPKVPTGSWSAATQQGAVLHDGAGEPVLEFTDYQCPFCKRADDRIIANTTSHHRLIVIQYPLPIHAHALAAATAAECAKDQGAFAPFHHALFANQAAIEKEAWGTIAQGIPEISVPALIACMGAGAARRRVQSQIAIGRAIRVGATPTFFSRRREIQLDAVYPAVVAKVR
jgi:hypothetical protein